MFMRLTAMTLVFVSCPAGGAAGLSKSENIGKLLFRSREDGQAQIWTMNANGSDKRRITCNIDGDVQAATWSPNGQWIIFYSQFPNNTQKLCLIGANEESCGPGTLLTEGGFADWSPVGQKIAFDRGSLGVRDIYVMYRDGTVVNVTNDPGERNTRPSWSPDGKRIAFAHGPGVADGPNLDIFVMNEDGSLPWNQLTFDALGNNGPRFSPDGRKIAFQSARDGNTEIYVMNADGTEQTRLTNYPGSDAFPNWAPDGQKIIFHRQVFDLEHPGGVNQLFIMNADGSDQTQITFPPTTNMFPAWGPGHVRLAAWGLGGVLTRGRPPILGSKGRSGSLSPAGRRWVLQSTASRPLPATASVVSVKFAFARDRVSALACTGGK